MRLTASSPFLDSREVARNSRARKKKKKKKKKKTGANERKGAWGEESLLVYFSSLQSRCAMSTPSRLTRKGLLAVYKGRGMGRGRRGEEGLM